MKSFTGDLRRENRRHGATGSGFLGYGVGLARDGEFVAFVPRDGWHRLKVGGPYRTADEATTAVKIAQRGERGASF